MNAEIVMTFEGQSWSLKPSDVGVSVDTDAQLAKAWQLGREGTPAEQKDAINALKENPVDLDVTLSYDRAAIETLPERERQVIALRFYHGMTQQNCAKVMHVSQVQISRLERRAVELLREKLE